MWKINAGRGSQLAREFLDREVVAIGWREAGDFTGLRSKSAVAECVAKAYPDNTDRQNEVGASQVWRFLNDVAVGDSVITYDPVERLYHLGKNCRSAPLFSRTNRPITSSASRQMGTVSFPRRA